jgi:hypothetical protein
LATKDQEPREEPMAVFLFFSSGEMKKLIKFRRNYPSNCLSGGSGGGSSSSSTIGSPLLATPFHQLLLCNLFWLWAFSPRGAISPPLAADGKTTTSCSRLTFCYYIYLSEIVFFFGQHLLISLISRWRNTQQKICISFSLVLHFVD